MKKLLTILLSILCLMSFVACNDAMIVQHNISRQSDKFDTYRLVTVINLRSDKILLEVEGYISIQNTEGDELAIIIQTGNRKGKVIPEKQWIDDIVAYCNKWGIKVFMKKSLKKIMGEDFRQDKLIWEIQQR